MEIRELTRMQENLWNDLEDAKDEVERNLRYERYLETVLEAPDVSYGEIQDLLNRHKTLRVTNEDLRARDERLNVDAEETRARLHAYVKRMTDERLNLNNDIAKLKKRLEAATLGGARAEGERGGWQARGTGPSSTAEQSPRRRICSNGVGDGATCSTRGRRIRSSSFTS